MGVPILVATIWLDGDFHTEGFIPFGARVCVPEILPFGNPSGDTSPDHFFDRMSYAVEPSWKEVCCVQAIEFRVAAQLIRVPADEAFGPVGFFALAAFSTGPELQNRLSATKRGLGINAPVAVSLHVRYPTLKGKQWSNKRSDTRGGLTTSYLRAQVH